MALGDGVRRNIAHVDPTERMLLRDAIIEMNHRYFPGNENETPPGHVSWWFKQDEIHQATHVHGGPEFLPWHREVTNHFEELLRQINPQLSLHYWDFKDDPRSAPDGKGGTVNLFTDLLPDGKPFMGSPGIQEDVDPNGGPIGEPWLGAGFYDPLAGTPPMPGMPPHPPDRETSGHPFDPPKFVMRPSNYPPGPLPKPLITANQENTILALQQFGPGRWNPAQPGIPQNHSNDAAFRAIKPNFFRTAWEDIHNSAHGYFADISPHDAFRDPFVFLLHSNVDRVYSAWQLDPAHPERLDPNTIYGSESDMDVDVIAVGTHSVQNLTHLVEPWSTGHGEFTVIRPWESTHENQGFPHDYHHISVVAPGCYDNPPNFRIDEVENPFNAATNRYQIIFNDVPETETTWRAAVIRVYTCVDTTLRVKPGTEPGAPFGVAIGQAQAVHGAHPHAYQDVRLWFSYTAGALGTAGAGGQDVGPVNTTIICDQTAQQFEFELRAHYIHRPTVAVQLVLDQSLSMNDPAGTSGRTRLAVLKDSADLFATAIQDNNGLGIIRFDENAYPPNDPTYGGMPITKILSDADRDIAHAAIAAHGAHGSTSIGDGLVMGHSQIVALPPGAYDRTAMLLLTDGLENEPVSIADAVGMGAVDHQTFAIGLGNEFQVNTGALNAITGATGGNLLLSGILTPNTDDFFRVKKFFLQILAAVTNTSIVRDPVGYINIGTRIRIPFELSEADIDCRVILLTDYQVVSMTLESPDGQAIDPGNAVGFGASYKTTGPTMTVSFGLPVVSQGAEIPPGTWYVVLEIDKKSYNRVIDSLGDKDPQAVGELRGKGARYCVSMHSFSNLRMTAATSQTSYRPGSAIGIHATLKEYEQPVDHRAQVQAEVEYPNRSRSTVTLSENMPGAFEATLIAPMPGIYRFTVRAEGGTYRRTPFTREQVLTAAVFDELVQPPSLPEENSRWCEFLTCVLQGESVLRYLEKVGIDAKELDRCVRGACGK
jgi:hypothetical protein